MSDFNPLEGRALIRSNGVFFNAPLFERNSYIFAKYGKGFIQMRSDKTTSHPKVMWKELELTDSYTSQVGNLVITQKDPSSYARK